MKETLKRRPISSLLGQIDFSADNVMAAVCVNSVLFIEAVEYRREALAARAGAKMVWERAQAEFELSVRKAYREADEKITEGNIKALTLLDPTVVEAADAYAKAEEVDEYMKLVVEAFRMRRDCLAIVKDLLRNEIGAQSAYEAGAEKLAETRAALRKKFPGGK